MRGERSIRGLRRRHAAHAADIARNRRTAEEGAVLALRAKQPWTERELCTRRELHRRRNPCLEVTRAIGPACRWNVQRVRAWTDADAGLQA